MRKFKKDLHKSKGILDRLVIRLNVKIVATSERINLKFSAQELFIYCFGETGKLIPKFIWDGRRSRRTKNGFEKENRVTRFIFPDFTISYSPVGTTSERWLERSSAHAP